MTKSISQGIRNFLTYVQDQDTLWSSIEFLHQINIADGMLTQITWAQPKYSLETNYKQKTNWCKSKTMRQLNVHSELKVIVIVFHALFSITHFDLHLLRYFFRFIASNIISRWYNYRYGKNDAKTNIYRIFQSGSNNDDVISFHNTLNSDPLLLLTDIEFTAA